MGFNQQISVFEHQKMIVGKSYNGIQFTEGHRIALEKYYGNGSKCPYFSLIHKGVQFKEFVGVLQIGELTIEILPKTDKYEDVGTWRDILINMLQAVGLFKISASDFSNLKTKPNFILELYFQLFIQEFEYLIREGLIKQYRQSSKNTSSLKGRLNFGKNISKNLIHQERFYTEHTVYDAEHLLNQILYKTLQVINRVNLDQGLKSRIMRAQMLCPELPDLAVNEATFSRIVLTRKTERYRTAIEISKLILLNFHPDISKGQNHVLAIMFDMNLLWERFIYVSLRKFAPLGYRVTPQSRRYFWKPINGSNSTLRPDLVIENGDDRVILDTKWKSLGSRNPSPDDLRQLYVYNQYYHSQRAALIYPGENEIRPGRYYDPEFAKHKGVESLSAEECSLIFVSPDVQIWAWQKSIAESIYTKWPTLIN